MSNRDDFSKKTKNAVAARAGWHCSFTGCGKSTVGPSEESSDAVIMIGKAARVLVPRRIIWPVLRAILPPTRRKAAHVWHTWPMLRVGFVSGLAKGRLTGVQCPRFGCLKFGPPSRKKGGNPTAERIQLCPIFAWVLAGHIYCDQRFKGKGELFLTSLATNTCVAEV
jgi:hypothetical protein